MTIQLIFNQIHSRISIAQTSTRYIACTTPNPPSDRIIYHSIWRTTDTQQTIRPHYIVAERKCQFTAISSLAVPHPIKSQSALDAESRAMQSTNNFIMHFGVQLRCIVILDQSKCATSRFRFYCQKIEIHKICFEIMRCGYAMVEWIFFLVTHAS